MSDEVRTGMLPGFAVLLETELLDARRSKRMVAFPVVMTFILIWIPVIGFNTAENYAESGRHVLSEGGLEGLIGAWAGLVGYMGAMFVISSTGDALAYDRSVGVTSWIVTKPVSRLSYLSAKATAHAVLACVLIVIVPSTAWYLLTILLFHGISPLPVLGAILILCIEMTFLSFFVVSVSVMFRSVAPIAIVSLALLFLPALLPVVAQKEWILYFLPSYLPVAAITAGVSATATLTFTLPLAAIILGCVVFGLATWSFERQEL